MGILFPIVEFMLQTVILSICIKQTFDKLTHQRPRSNRWTKRLEMFVVYIISNGLGVR